MISLYSSFSDLFTLILDVHNFAVAGTVLDYPKMHGHRGRAGYSDVRD